MQTLTVAAKNSGLTVREMVQQLKLAGFDVVRWRFVNGNVMLEGMKSAS